MKDWKQQQQAFIKWRRTGKTLVLIFCEYHKGQKNIVLERLMQESLLNCKSYYPYNRYNSKLICHYSGLYTFLNGPNPASFCFIFVLFTWQIWHKFDYKSIDGVLETRTRGGRMVGADESSEMSKILWIGLRVSVTRKNRQM